MNSATYLLTYFFWGVCLGATMHIGTWSMSKGLHWIIEALTGKK